MSKHAEPHALAGQEVALVEQLHAGATFRIEDYWDRVAGQSWMDSVGNPAALTYAARAGLIGLPLDDEVIYGKVGNAGVLVHVSEVQPA